MECSSSRLGFQLLSAVCTSRNSILYYITLHYIILSETHQITWRLRFLSDTPNDKGQFGLVIWGKETLIIKSLQPTRDIFIQCYWLSLKILTSSSYRTWMLEILTCTFLMTWVTSFSIKVSCFSNVGFSVKYKQISAPTVLFCFCFFKFSHQERWWNESKNVKNPE